jgi:glutamate-1-semialdehyde 2,1-aminomutase
MSHMAPLGEVYQAGTLSGNPLATAAGLATLSQLDAADYLRLEATAATLADGLTSVIAAAGLPVQVPRVGPLLGLFFADSPVDGYESARESVANGLYRRFFTALLDRGVALAPGPYEVLFPSLAHSPNHVEATIEAAAEAAREVAAS